MALKTAEASVGVGLGLAATTSIIFMMHLPSIADSRSIEPDNPDLQKSRRTAVVMSAVIVGGVGLITGDATAYIIGGLAIVGWDWLYRHADQVNPATGSATANLTVLPGGGGQTESSDSAQVTYMDAMV